MPHHPDQTLKERGIRYISRISRGRPRLARFIQRLYRRLQGRFTVGAVGVLLDEQERVLLVEHVFHPSYPWGLPGGWVGRGELPQRAVEREFHEETDLTVKVIYPLEIWSRKWPNHVDMAFAVESQIVIQPDTIRLSSELLNYQWASRDNLPPLLPEHIHVIDVAITRYRQSQQYQDESTRR